MRTLWSAARLTLTAALLLAGLAPEALYSAPPSIAAGDGPDYTRPYNCGGGETSYAATPNQAIPDLGVITSTVNVSGQGPWLWTVAVSVTIEHSSNADLELFLISPAGTTVTLSTDNGGAYDDAFRGTLFSDKAGETLPPGPVTMADIVSDGPLGLVAPEEPLGAFRAEDPNGTWSLVVQDDLGAEDGTLVSWQLFLDVLGHAPHELNQEEFGNVANLPIPDTGEPVTLTYGFDSEPVAALGYVRLRTEIEHPRVSDLVIELITNTGVTLTVSSHQGGDNLGVFDGTFWYDEAGEANPPGALTDSSFISGTVSQFLAPQEGLAAANGVNAGAGTWRLVVYDTVSGETGMLDEASLTVISFACQPDLQLDIDRPFAARLDAPAPLVLKVENGGMNTSAPVYLTATLPSELSFISAAGTGWTCGGVDPGDLGGDLLCSTPSLSAATTASVTVLFDPPPGPMVTERFTVTVSTVNNLNQDEDTNLDMRFSAHSANGNPWDVADLASISELATFNDAGSMQDGGQDAFDDWGLLRLKVFAAGGSQLAGFPMDDILIGFGLVYVSGHHWTTTTPVVTDTIQVSRDLYAPPGEDWLRYVDTFTNTGGAPRTLWVAWGGNLGSDNETELTSTSSGDQALTAGDTWAVTTEQDDPPVMDPPLAYILRSPTDATYQGPGLFYNNPFTDTWPGGDDSNWDDLGHIYKLTLAPGASASLAYFVYRGLAETTEDEDYHGPEDCEFYGDCVAQPEAGSQVALAETTAAALAAEPNFCGLSEDQLALIVNWPGLDLGCPPSRLYLPLVTR